MTQYAKDFSDELTTGVFPSDFTERWDTGTATPTVETFSGSEDNRVFQIDQPGDQYLASWDDVDADGTRDNCEICIRFRQATDNYGNVLIAGRASGAVTAETCYLFTHQTPGHFYLYRYNAGSATQLGNSVDLNAIGSPIYFDEAGNNIWAPFYFQEDVWTWMRLRINGTGATVTVQAKMWLDGCPEPQQWTFDYADTDASRVTAAGWIGVGRYTLSGTLYVDYLGVGTNGDAAPINVNAATTVRMSAIWVEVAVAYDDPNLRVYNAIRETMHSANNPVVRVTQMGIQVAHEVGYPIASGLGGPINTIN